MKNLPPDLAVRARVAQRLKGLRRERALTQEQLAQRLGMGLKAVQRLESGHHNPTLDTLGHVAKGFAVDVSVLLEPQDVGTTALAGLVAAGWRVRQPRARRGRSVAVVALSHDGVPSGGAVAGRPLPGEVVAEALPPAGRKLSVQGLFLALIDDRGGDGAQGPWGLFRRVAAQPWEGRSLLLWRGGQVGWQLRRVAAVEAPQEVGWRLQLTSREGGKATEVMVCTALDEVQACGELIEVIGASDQ